MPFFLCFVRLVFLPAEVAKSTGSGVLLTMGGAPTPGQLKIIEAKTCGGFCYSQALWCLGRWSRDEESTKEVVTVQLNLETFTKTGAPGTFLIPVHHFGFASIIWGDRAHIVDWTTRPAELRVFPASWWSFGSGARVRDVMLRSKAISLYYLLLKEI